VKIWPKKGGLPSCVKLAQFGKPGQVSESKSGNIYQMARTVIEDNPQWYASQKRTVWKNHTSRVVLSEGRQMLWLAAWHGNQMVQVQAGLLDPLNGWLFVLDEATYGRWKDKVLETFRHGKDGARVTVAQ
jgi:hypothetical protein